LPHDTGPNSPFRLWENIRSLIRAAVETVAEQAARKAIYR
jgi:hypothetical protein